MKRHIFIVLTMAFLAGAAQAQPAMPAGATAPKTDFSKLFGSDKEKFSYAIGMSTAASLKQVEMECDPDALMRGLKDSLGKGPPLITLEQEKEILADLNADIRARMAEKQKQLAEEQRIKGEKNLRDGPAFLAKNKVLPGVITTASGLQYKVVTEGTGPTPGPNDEVSVNYRGTVIDGTEFDNSAKMGKPLVARVGGGVIPGWTEVLQLMKVGSKYQVFIPANLAYGATARGPVIAPNSVLIFEMELVSVKPAQPAQSGAVAAPTAGAVMTSDVIRVPSKEAMDKGEKIETIKNEDLEKEKAKAGK